MACGIYKITNLINGKVYIGLSINIEERWKEHKKKPYQENSEEYNYPLYQAIRKYGLKNFKFEVLEECSPKDLNLKEIDYIALYESYPSSKGKGYNLVPGGNLGCPNKIKNNLLFKIIEDLKLQELTLLQIAEKYKVDKMTIHNINYGKESYFREDIIYPIREKHLAPEYKCEICGAKTSNGYFRCIKCRHEMLKISLPPKEDLLKDLYELRKDYLVAEKYKISTMLLKDWKIKLGIPRKRREVDELYEREYIQLNPKKKTYKVLRGKIAQINIETGEILNTFKSAAEACRFLGKDEKNTEPIRKCAKGELFQAYGFRWKYSN